MSILSLIKNRKNKFRRRGTYYREARGFSVIFTSNHESQDQKLDVEVPITAKHAVSLQKKIKSTENRVKILNFTRLFYQRRNLRGFSILRGFSAFFRSNKESQDQN